MCSFPRLFAAYHGLLRLTAPTGIHHRPIVRLTILLFPLDTSLFPRLQDFPIKRVLLPLVPYLANLRCVSPFQVLHSVFLTLYCQKSRHVPRSPASLPFPLPFGKRGKERITSKIKIRQICVYTSLSSTELAGLQANPIRFSFTELKHSSFSALTFSHRKGGDPAALSSTTTLLRLHPPHKAYLRQLPPCG